MISILKMEAAKFYTMEEILDHHFGVEGSKRRKDFEQRVDKAVNKWRTLHQKA